MFKKILFGALVVSSIGSIATPAAAATYVRVAPPEPRSEVAPAPRRGYAWAPGYWNWRNGRHVWTNGHYVRERRGYTYNSPNWVESNGRWRLQQGRWARGDRDGDGVPNGMDRHPNNPNRN